MRKEEWAFVDLENIGTLKNISIDKYDVVYVFVGSKQSSISLETKSNDKFIEIKVLKIKDSSKNNLDFHLSYYLGKLDSSAIKDVIFTVISKDKGFDNLIKHINATGRKCKRLAIENEGEKVTKEMLLKILEKGIEKAPKSETALKNHINSKLGINSSEQKIKSIYNSLIKNKKIADRIT